MSYVISLAAPVPSGTAAHSNIMNDKPEDRKYQVYLVYLAWQFLKRSSDLKRDPKLNILKLTISNTVLPIHIR